MNISLEKLSIEEAREILSWMEQDGCTLFLKQLGITESYLIERMLRSDQKDTDAAKILALRTFPAYHDQLIAFLEERVTQQDEK